MGTGDVQRYASHDGWCMRGWMFVCTYARGEGMYLLTDIRRSLYLYI